MLSKSQPKTNIAAGPLSGAISPATEVAEELTQENHAAGVAQSRLV